MRSSICTALIASATFLSTSMAAPPFTPLHSHGEAGNPKDVMVAYHAEEDALKYFHEPGSNDTFGHYDRRFFHGVVTDEERTDTQSHMIRAYLNFFRDNKLDTWIAHGTLLGWWWNGKRLPWDFDLDTQVSDVTLNRLGDTYNQTRYKYTSADGKVQREYLLDINPWMVERVRGNGMNIIDARWIDVRNGLFVDITGLSETKPDIFPGIWSCKNNHRYHTTELYPMRQTMFEGVVAEVPYAYDKILTDEYYESALVNTHFMGHEWNTTLREWVKSPETLRIEEEMRKIREGEIKRAAMNRSKLD